MDRYGYLGPQGTFAEMALLAWPDATGAEHIPFGSVDAALAAVRSGTVEAAMVPIENSVEGGVTATLDALAQGRPLVIIGEVLVPITFVLAVRPGTSLAVVRAIGTHSHAWAQVRAWAGAYLPDATYVPTLSTAASAADLAQGDGDGPSYQGAVCAPVAAEHYGLEVLEHDVGDNPNAVTRFVVVTRPGVIPAPTGTDKTTLVLFQKEDHAGGLLELLEQFAVRGINMTRLESRPTGASMGSYCFS
ncbi:MAG TPA: prephenate dehydratase, partial [Candidatus Lustribacter sp.]|nr:prephenate dehydratase [Candidatus Lustribacter sp.]